MEKKVYCRYCDEEHIVSETMDSAGKVVGVFCNREKAMVAVNTTLWNGDDIYPRIERFARSNVDLQALANIKSEKVAGLSRKMAYLFLQTPYAKEAYINYYFAQYHMLDVIRRMRSRASFAKVGD